MAERFRNWILTVDEDVFRFWIGALLIAVILPLALLTLVYALFAKRLPSINEYCGYGQLWLMALTVAAVALVEVVARHASTATNILLASYAAILVIVLVSVLVWARLTFEGANKITGADQLLGGAGAVWLVIAAKVGTGAIEASRPIGGQP